MTNFPNSLDDDTSIPRVDNNITEIGGDVINAERDAIFAIESNIGIGAAGSTASIAARLGVSLNPDGTLAPSVITSLYNTIGITNQQVASGAAISESKLNLSYSTAALNSAIATNAIDVQTALQYISNTGFKLQPHLDGTGYRHEMNMIDVDENPANWFLNNLGNFRNNTNLYTLFGDINQDLINHENAVHPGALTPPPTSYAHWASGIFVNTSGFISIPQTADDVQQLAEYIDSANVFLIGSRIQTLYQNGIARAARASTLTDPTHGKLVLPPTQSITYRSNSAPTDNNITGNDIIKITPTDGYTAFTAQFSQVKIGDIVTVNYGSVVASFIVKETRIDGYTGTYGYIRIDRQNIAAVSNALVQINRPLFNTDKQGVLALAQCQSPVGLPSLICGQPRGAEILGIDFNADTLDSAHYNLYLTLYPTGNPAQGNTLPAIDVTGNQGATPGKYTLDSIVAATNAAFRAPGYNYRFIAYQYQGNFGVMLSDPYGGATFSIVSQIVNQTTGVPDQTQTQLFYPNNVVDTFNIIDPLGFGPLNANVASPPYQTTYGSVAAAQLPTKIFVPLTKKTFYVNGQDRDTLGLEPGQLFDGYGDGYWLANIISVNLTGRVQTTYQVNEDLSSSGLAIGKTIVVQSNAGDGSQVDFGRFIIENVVYNACNCDGYSNYAQITVYDAVHGTGVTPFATSPIGTTVQLYFAQDSVSFNKENASDSNSFTIFKRNFEILVDQDGYTFSQERARMNVSGSNQTINASPLVVLYSTPSASFINLYKVSPKLRGYTAANTTKITLQLLAFNTTTGIFDGYLCSYDGVSATHSGPIATGKMGQPTRFYDETNIDYIDFIFNVDDSVPTILSPQFIDVQLYPSLSLDEELLLLGTCQLNDLTSQLTYLRDERQFGNVSEKQLSTSALDYIATPTRLLNENGIIRGFDITQIPTGASPFPNAVAINGGTAIINGKVIQMNNDIIALPVVQEVVGANLNNTITWFICVNDKSEFELVASTDFTPNSAIYSGLDETRLFTVQNPNLGSPTPYVIRGTYLADLVQNQRDLALIGIITANVGFGISNWVVTSVGTQTAASCDARRFIGGGYSGLISPFVLGTNGSFRSFAALNGWINQLTNFVSATHKNNSISKKVIVKGNFPITAPVTLNFSDEITFEGDGGVFTINIATGIFVGNNVKFKNVRFDYNFAISNDGYLGHQANAAVYCVVDPVNGNKNISFEHCLFTSATQYRYGFLTFSLTHSTCLLENVVIIDNRFETSAAADDQMEVITFVGPSRSPTTATGARLNNCVIERNFCNKNQLIQIAPLLTINLFTSSANVFDLPAATNTRIVGNTCGAINVMVKQDTPLNIPNVNFNLGSTAGVIISENNCKFIYSGFTNGNFAQGSFSSINAIPGGFNFLVGNLSITNNNVSFIYTGYRSTIYATPTCIVKANKFTAYNSAFLTPYFNGVVQPQSGLLALWVNKVVGN